MVELGDYVERSDWFWDEPSKSLAERCICEAIAHTLNGLGAGHTPVEWETLYHDDPRVITDPPRQGCYLRVGHVRITKLPLHIVTGTPLSKDLGREDLEKMRAATRLAHEANFPLLSKLTDDQCDTIIDSVGPTTAVRELVG